MASEMGIGDYLHALEIWRDQVRAWWWSLPMRPRNALLSDLARLACLHDAARTRAILLRRMLGYEEPLPTELNLDLSDVVTSLAIVMRRMRTAYATLAADSASIGLPAPPAPPTGGIRLVPSGTTGPALESPLTAAPTVASAGKP